MKLDCGAETQCNYLCLKARRLQDCKPGFHIKAFPKHRHPWSEGEPASLPHWEAPCSRTAYPLPLPPHSEEPNTQAFPQHME